MAELLVGTYRGIIVSHALGKTREYEDKATKEKKGGLAQLVIKVVGNEEFDEVEKEWVDLPEDGEMVGTGYFVMVSNKQEKTLNCTQIEKIFQWDGTSLEELESADSADAGIQFRVEENTYEGKTTMQITWIDEFDAEPSRGLRKMSPDDVKALQAKYSSVFKATKKVATAPKSETKPKTGAKPKVTATPKLDPAKETAKEVKEDDIPFEDKYNLGEGDSPPEIPEANTSTSSRKDAWEACYKLKSKDVTTEMLSDVWVKAIKKVAPGKTDKTITPAEWFQIQTIVTSKTTGS